MVASSQFRCLCGGVYEVLESRPDPKGSPVIFRRRRCRHCGLRVKTVEQIIVDEGDYSRAQKETIFKKLDELKKAIKDFVRDAD